MKFPKNKKPVSISLTALSGIPLVRPGDNLVELIFKSLKSTEMILLDNDILVIAQKVVSKSEGRYVKISDVEPSEKSYLLAKSSGKDPRLVELIRRESKKIVRHRKGVIVTENRQGVTMANSGIDRSNVEKDGDSEQVLLLPRNPDKSAEKIVKTVKTTGAIVTGPIPLPTKRKIFTVLKSPHVNKKSREQFQLSSYKRLMDIYSSSSKTIDALMKLELPSGVEVEIKV